MKNTIRRFIRFVTREVAAELATTNRPTPRMPIDVEDLITALCQPQANAALQRFFSGNHRFVAMLAERNRRAARDTYDFVDAEMPQALFNPNQMQIIEAKRDQILTLDGHILDLGVYKGSSTRHLARIFPDKVVHGFDSFEGLPGDWTHAVKGAFGDMKGILPEMPDNVRLYKGWFEDSLPVWLSGHNEKLISLLRIDCDLYSSTKTIFDVLHPLIKSGTWIVFDELIGYRGYRDHELKAFQEFIAKTGFEYEYVAYGLTYAILYLK